MRCPPAPLLFTSARMAKPDLTLRLDFNAALGLPPPLPAPAAALAPAPVLPLHPALSLGFDHVFLPSFAFHAPRDGALEINMDAIEQEVEPAREDFAERARRDPLTSTLGKYWR